MALIALIASSLALAQSQFQENLGIINPDLIYFNDGGQRYPSLQPVNSQGLPNMNRFSENQQSDQSIRQPVNMIPQIGQFSNAGIMSVSPVKRPSHDLEPPHSDRNEQIDRNQQQADQAHALNRFSDDASEPNMVNPRPTNVGMQPAPVAPVDLASRAITQFGINIMKIIQNQPGNQVVSPYSIGTLLSLLQQGSLGATQQQIANALQMTPNDSTDGFKRLTESLEKRISNNIFKLGNAMFIADGFSINPAFKRIAMRDFGSEVNPIKFSRPDRAAAIINNWVAAKTSNKITKLVAPENIAENTQLALVNTVYFKGLWAVKFKPESTMTKDFYLPNGGVKKADFMRMRRYLRADYDPSIGSQVLVLPFEGGQYSLVVILPTQSGTVASAMSALTSERLLTYQKFTPKEVALELPKFTVKSDTNLVNVLKQMGIINIFGPGSDLSGIGNYREFVPQVSSAVHSALLSIDEQGGVAAAATSFGVVALSYDDPSISFTANRPFIAVLWDNETSVPLFMAKVEDPVQ